MPMTEKKSSLIRFKNALSLFFAYSVVGKKEGEGPLGHCFDSVCGDSLLGEKSWEKGKSRMQQLALDGDFAAAGEKVKRGKKATKKPTP